MEMSRNHLIATASSSVLVLLLLVGQALGAAKPLPSFIKPCSRNDPELNKCAIASARVAVPKLKNGIPDYGVPSLDPLFIKEVRVDRKALGLDMVISDVLIYGLGESKVLDINIDVEPAFFRWRLQAPRLVMLGQYEADGRILILPIKGKGAINITLDKVEYTYSFKNKLVKKPDGEEYLVPTTSDIDHKLGRTYFILENLFNGNKLLGEEMNRFLNENWKEVTDQLGPSIVKSIAAAIKSIVENITSRVPYKKIILDQV